MAITPVACQAVLGSNPMNVQILRADETQGSDATKQEWYVAGNADAPGRVRWYSITVSDDAVIQVVSFLTQLRAG